MKRLGVFAWCLGLALLPTGPAVADEAELIGLWGAHRPFLPSFAGTIVLDTSSTASRLDQSTLAAWVDGVEYPVKVRRRAGNAEHGKVSVSFEVVGRGRFEAAVGGGPDWASRPIRGHWIQPPGVIELYGYASPLTFKPVAGQTGRFAGEVVPFQETLTLYIDISRRQDGSLAAFVRNPNRNTGLWFRPDRVERASRNIRFLSDSGDVMAEGLWQPEFEKISLFLPRFQATLDLQRVRRDRAVGFAPRAAYRSATRLLQPVPGGGWDTASPESVAMDPEKLRALIDRIASITMDSVYAEAVHAVLVARRGKLVMEEYFAGNNATTPHDSRSAGKSVASMILGAVLHQRETTNGTPAAQSLSQPVCDAISWAGTACGSDARKRAINATHLVTMTSGMECDDNNPDSIGNEGNMQNQSRQPDWYRYTMDIPMQRQPGEAGVYCTAGINLIGALVTAWTGEPTYRLFDRLLAEPLGIDQYHMNLSPAGRGYLGGGIRLLPRDLLKLGELMRNRGRWHGQTLLSPAWVTDSFRPRASVNEPDDYGYAWWRKSYDFGGRSIQTYYASGNGGQLLFVVPELELTVLMHGGNYGNFGTWRRFRDEMLPEYILAAAVPTSG